MIQNEQIIHDFYTAFQRKDYVTMQECYANNATFSDEVFVGLNAKEVKAMWEMLVKRGNDLVIEYRIVKVDEKNGESDWVATYTFSKTKRRVVNKIHSEFLFENGKIVRHKDKFNFYKWSRQALGLTGLFLGWMPLFKRKIQNNAFKNLEQYIQKKSNSL